MSGLPSSLDETPKELWTGGAPPALLGRSLTGDWRRGLGLGKGRRPGELSRVARDLVWPSHATSHERLRGKPLWLVASQRGATDEALGRAPQKTYGASLPFHGWIYVQDGSN